MKKKRWEKSIKFKFINHKLSSKQFNDKEVMTLMLNKIQQ